jgi:DNA-binding IclR family transcriptional regulator
MQPSQPEPVPPEVPESRSDTVSALERGISVLRCFSQDKPVLGYADIAKMTGIPRPTVNRLVATLAATGMLKPALAADRFTLGPAVISLARVFLVSLDVRALARPKMMAMAEELGCSVYLALRDGMEMVLIEACRPNSSILSPRLDVGSRAPIPSSALGRAYLSALDDARRTQLVETLRMLRGPEWDRIGPGMQRAVDEAQRLGYCLSLGEFHHEINSVSVPLVGPGDEIMALNCGGAAFMFTEQRLREEFAPRLMDIARSIAHDIGGHVPATRTQQSA